MSTLNLADDLLIVDDLQPVVFRSRTDEAAFTDYPVPKALRRSATFEMLKDAGHLLGQIGVVWHVLARDIEPAIPKPRDVVRDRQGRRWTVLKAEAMDELGRYRLTCVIEQ